MESSSATVKRITLWNVFLNIIISLIKFVLGYLGRSQAVIADSVHSLSDLTSDLAILFGVKYWSQPPDRSHPYGHHKIESVVTSIIGILLALAAVGITWNAITSINDRQVSRAGYIAVIGPAISILLKEIMYRWNKTVGIRIKSSALVANAWHHRSDALSSVPVLLAAAAAAWDPRLAVIDTIGACVISIFLLRISYKILKSAFLELVDTALTEKEVADITEEILAIPDVLGVHQVRSRKAAGSIFIDLHLEVDPLLTVLKSHAISETVEKTVSDLNPEITDIIVHIEPREDA